MTEWLKVLGKSDKAVSTVQSYRAGTKLRIWAWGTYSMRGGDGWIVADAECTSVPNDVWRPMRALVTGLFNGAADTPLGDLAINGEIGQWLPEDKTGDCDEQEHTYSRLVTTTKDGPLSFVVVDNYYPDNSGQLGVMVYPL